MQPQEGFVSSADYSFWAHASGHTPGHTRRIFRSVCSEDGRKTRQGDGFIGRSPSARNIFTAPFRRVTDLAPSQTACRSRQGRRREPRESQGWSRGIRMSSSRTSCCPLAERRNGHPEHGPRGHPGGLRRSRQPQKKNVNNKTGG